MGENSKNTKKTFPKIYVGSFKEFKKLKTDLEFIMLLKGNCLLKMEQHLTMKLSSIFEFQPAPLSFSVILEDIFIVSPSYSMRKGEFFPKSFSQRRQILMQIDGDFVLHGIIMTKSSQEGGGRAGGGEVEGQEFYKMNFSVI